jgi:hypothetical protein
MRPARKIDLSGFLGIDKSKLSGKIKTSGYQVKSSREPFALWTRISEFKGFLMFSDLNEIAKNHEYLIEALGAFLPFLLAILRSYCCVGASHRL